MECLWSGDVVQSFGAQGNLKNHSVWKLPKKVPRLYILKAYNYYILKENISLMTFRVHNTHWEVDLKSHEVRSILSLNLELFYKHSIALACFSHLYGFGPFKTTSFFSMIWYLEPLLICKRLTLFLAFTNCSIFWNFRCL